MEALSDAAVKVLHLLGNTAVTHVDTTVGSEQEYFLIDKDLYKKRKDLLLTGRTLMGAPAPKGQEMEDHYFGVLKPKVSEYMHALDKELWELGVTRSLLPSTSWRRSLRRPTWQWTTTS